MVIENLTPITGVDDGSARTGVDDLTVETVVDNSST